MGEGTSDPKVGLFPKVIYRFRPTSEPTSHLYLDGYPRDWVCVELYVSEKLCFRPYTPLKTPRAHAASLLACCEHHTLRCPPSGRWLRGRIEPVGVPCGRIEQRAVRCSTRPSAGSLQPGNRSMVRTHSRLAKSRTHSRWAKSRGVGQPMLCRQHLGRTIGEWSIRSLREITAADSAVQSRLSADHATAVKWSHAHARSWHNWNFLDVLHVLHALQHPAVRGHFSTPQQQHGHI